MEYTNWQTCSFVNRVYSRRVCYIHTCTRTHTSDIMHNSDNSLCRPQQWLLLRKTTSPHICKLNARLLQLEIPTHYVAGNLRCQSTADKQGQSDTGHAALTDISMLRPELQQEWHAERNKHLGDIEVKPQSNIKAVWSCDQCPAGQPHVWSASVANRTRGTKCPYCSNRLVCLHNSLATLAPEVAQYWHHSKNKRSSQQVLAGSNFRAEWKCPACKWEWQAPVQNRVRSNAGCPKCSALKQIWQPQPTFAEAQPACLAEWDYELNDAEDIHPENTTLGSGKMVHWVCSCCPRGQPHRWRARPYSRIGDGMGCAVCAGRQACICNSLESLFPSLATEFDVDKNGFAPSEVTASSARKVWWRTVARGSWRQSPNMRTDRRRWPDKRQAGV